MTFLPAVPRLTERRFLQEVVDLAALLRWRAYHTHRSEHSAAGFPDLVLVRRPRVIFAELKSDRGKVTPDQYSWLIELRECRVETYIWRPSDFEKIQRILR